MSELIKQAVVKEDGTIFLFSLPEMQEGAVPVVTISPEHDRELEDKAEDPVLTDMGDHVTAEYIVTPKTAPELLERKHLRMLQALDQRMTHLLLTDAFVADKQNYNDHMVNLNQLADANDLVGLKDYNINVGWSWL